VQVRSCFNLFLASEPEVALEQAPGGRAAAGAQGCVGAGHPVGDAPVGQQPVGPGVMKARLPDEEERERSLAGAGR
jgi:hypothetical protein